MKKRLILIVTALIILCIIVLGIGFLYNKSFMIGNCILAKNGTYIIVSQETPIVMRNLTSNKDAFSDFETGDKILVVYDNILTSYPAQTGVYFCMQWGNGDISDISDDTLRVLSELGWIE